MSGNSRGERWKHPLRAARSNSLPAGVPESGAGGHGHYWAGALIIFAVLLWGPAGAPAAVVISSGATSNMSCSSGFCAPTAKNAVLNVGDLENLLGSGDVTVTTTGSGVQAKDVLVKAALGWSTTSELALDAYRSITIEGPVSVTGSGGVALTVDDGGSNGILFFGVGGNVSFASLSGRLAINGAAYALVNTLPALASAIAANPSGAFALAESYNASQDGTYASAPIPTTFAGSFDGLGNTISNLTINDPNPFQGVGDALFSEIGTSGSVASIGVTRVSIANTSGHGNFVAGIAGTNQGTIQNAFVSGKLTEAPNNSDAAAGGLVSWNFGGTIILSQARATVTVSSADNGAGGLVGIGNGSIIQSYATGAVSGGEGYAGGLMVTNDGSISESYATGRVTGGKTAAAGGLLGGNGGTVTQAYSTGQVKGPRHTAGGYKGGFVGDDLAQPGSISSAYWDTATSVKNPIHGAGNIKNDPGITGLTTEQLQSGLPAGFDPAVWAEDPNINNGFPYLLANPPPKK